MAKCSPARKARLKARHQAEAAEERQKSILLRKAGHSCSTCAHKSKMSSMAPKIACDLDSDWEGYAIVKPDFVCSRFEAVSPPAPAEVVAAELFRFGVKQLD